MRNSRYFALLAVALLFGACDMLLETDDRWGFLEFEASVEFSPDSTALLPVLHITNNSTDEVELTTGGCSSGLALAVYDDEGRRVWDFQRSLPERFASGERLICPAVLITLTVPPGESATTNRFIRIAVDNILGDSIPEGRYQITLRPDFNRGLDGPEFSVGEVDLRR